MGKKGDKAKKMGGRDGGGAKSPMFHSCKKLPRGGVRCSISESAGRGDNLSAWLARVSGKKRGVIGVGHEHPEIFFRLAVQH